MGLKITDFIHTKILIIGKKAAIISGRNADDKDYFLDLGYIARPIIPTQESLLDQLREIAEEIWNQAERLQGVETKRFRPVIDGVIPADDEKTKVVFTNDQQILDLAQARQFLNTDAQDPAANQNPLEFRPRKLRAIFHDCIGMALTGMFGNAMATRVRMPDDIVSALRTKLETAREFDLVAMSVFMVPELREAVVKALKNGAIGRTFTNSLSSSREFVPLGLTYIESLPWLISFLTTNAAKHLIYTLVPSKLFRYMHHKGARIDDTVIITSSNFNVPSTATNSEIAVEIEDKDFANHFKSRLDHLAQSHFSNLTCEMALREHRSLRNQALRILSYLFNNFY